MVVSFLALARRAAFEENLCPQRDFFVRPRAKRNAWRRVHVVRARLHEKLGSGHLTFHNLTEMRRYPSAAYPGQPPEPQQGGQQFGTVPTIPLMSQGASIHQLSSSTPPPFTTPTTTPPSSFGMQPRELAPPPIPSPSLSYGQQQLQQPLGPPPLGGGATTVPVGQLHSGGGSYPSPSSSFPGQQPSGFGNYGVATTTSGPPLGGFGGSVQSGVATSTHGYHGFPSSDVATSLDEDNAWGNPPTDVSSHNPFAASTAPPQAGEGE